MCLARYAYTRSETDGHDGLLAAVGELFSATPRQRCLVHKQRNVMAAIPRREREEVQAELSFLSWL